MDSLAQSVQQKRDELAELEKQATKVKIAALQAKEKELTIQEIDMYLQNDLDGKPNPPEIAAQFKKARELEAAHRAASAKVRAGVQKYAESKFMDMPEGGEKNCQIWNCYLHVFDGFDFLPVGQKPEYPTEEIRQLVEERNKANAAQFA